MTLAFAFGDNLFHSKNNKCRHRDHQITQYCPPWLAMAWKASSQPSPLLIHSRLMSQPKGIADLEKDGPDCWVQIKVFHDTDGIGGMALAGLHVILQSERKVAETVISRNLRRQGLATDQVALIEIGRSLVVIPEVGP